MPKLKDLASATTIILLAITIFFFATYLITLVIPVILIATLIYVVAELIKDEKKGGM